MKRAKVKRPTNGLRFVNAQFTEDEIAKMLAMTLARTAAGAVATICRWAVNGRDINSAVNGKGGAR